MYYSRRISQIPLGSTPRLRLSCASRPGFVNIPSDARIPSVAAMVTRYFNLCPAHVFVPQVPVASRLVQLHWFLACIGHLKPKPCIFGRCFLRPFDRRNMRAYSVLGQRMQPCGIPFQCSSVLAEGPRGKRAAGHDTYRKKVL